MSLPAIYLWRIDRHFGPFKSLPSVSTAVSQHAPGVPGLRAEVKRPPSYKQARRSISALTVNQTISLPCVPRSAHVRGGEKLLPRPARTSNPIILGLAVCSPCTHSTSYSWLLKGFVDPENESDLFSLASRRKFARELLKQWRSGYVRYGHIPNASHPRAKDVGADLPSCRRSSPGRAHLIDRQWSGRGASRRPRGD